MVTPRSLNGAGCAATYPAASVDANTKAAITLIFTEASLFLSGMAMPLPPSAPGHDTTAHRLRTGISAAARGFCGARNVTRFRVVYRDHRCALPGPDG